jgi:DNA-binding transcriptional LysR family regulator
MFTLYQLQIFQTVAQAGSISRAAERLYLTQPAVSQHVRALENELGVRLFEREARGVSLTPPGQLLLDYTRCLLRLAEEAQRVVTQTGGVRQGQLRIGASPGVGVFLLPGWIHAFHERYPELSVTLKTAPTPDVVQRLEAGQLDLGIVEGKVEHETIEATPLWDEEIAITVSRTHAWQDRQTIPSGELSDQGFILREEGSLTRAWEEHTLGNYGITPRVVAEFDTPVAIKQAVLSGLGIALLPHFAIQHELAAGLVRALSLREGPLVRTLRLLWSPDGRSNPVVHAFVGQLSGEFPHLPLQLGGEAELAQLLERLQSLPDQEAASTIIQACPTRPKSSQTG